MRNLPITNALAEARDCLNFSCYLNYADLWVPMTLKAGDIVRVDLPTRVPKTGLESFHGALGLDAIAHDLSEGRRFNKNYHAGIFNQGSGKLLMPRNAVVLGFDLTLDGYEIERVRLLRFSNGVDDRDFHPDVDQTQPVFEVGEIRHFSRPVTIRTSRLDIVPLTSLFFGAFSVDKSGSVHSPQALEKIKAAFRAAYGMREKAMRLFPDLEGTFFVPSLNPADWDNAFDFDLDENRHPIYTGIQYKDLDPGIRETLKEEAMEVRLQKVAARKDMFFAQMDFLEKMEKKRWKQSREKKSRKRSLLFDLRRLSHETRVQTVSDAIDAISAQDMDTWREITVSAKEKRVPDFKKVRDILPLPALLKSLSEKRTREASILSLSFRERCRGVPDDDLLADLKRIGVGNLLREPTVHLPDQLWRGRYLNLKIPDIYDEDVINTSSFRPCMIWDAFGLIDEEGNAVLAGLELYPCTRHSAKGSRFKMGVRPLDTKNKRQTFLLADILIRVPVTSQFFHINQPPAQGFFHLTQNQLHEFDVKRRIHNDLEGEPKVWGIKNRPADWVLMDLPEAPDEYTREALYRLHSGRKKPNGLAYRR